MRIDLSGKRALVSGSTGGIGRAISEGLARAGAAVTINGRTQQRVDQTLAELRSLVPGATFDGVAADLSTPEGASAVFERRPEVDILVNNVGTAKPKPFAELTDDDWLELFQLNVMSGVRLSRHYVAPMVSHGWGRIVFISSESALNIPKEMIDYGMTKTSQLAISRGLAETVAGTGVTVNAVLPGPTRSEGVTGYLEEAASKSGLTLDQMEEQFLATMRPTSLIGRFASTEEVANLVVYTCSTQASATSGAALRVDGGVVRYLA